MLRTACLRVFVESMHKLRGNTALYFVHNDMKGIVFIIVIFFIKKKKKKKKAYML